MKRKERQQQLEDAKNLQGYVVLVNAEPCSRCLLGDRPLLDPTGVQRVLDRCHPSIEVKIARASVASCS